MSAPPVSEALLAEAIELAQRAGTMTLSWFQSSSLDVEQKSDGTPVTDADRTAEQLIRDHLSVHHPDDSIVGEEHGRREGTSTRRWYIDPIDGTRSFVHGVPLFATLVAVEDEHGMAAGVIYLPALGETVAAGRGQGCIWNDSACRVSSTATHPRT
jgi:fructose-1,6-bisphosphatase/inositol monophosphatase family enzyme